MPKAMSQKFLKMAEVYKIFANEWKSMLDFSDVALKEMYEYESRGVPIIRPDNGFEVGKKWLNVHVAMWNKDIKDGILFRHELYDGTFPEWWLDQVLRA